MKFFLYSSCSLPSSVNRFIGKRLLIKKKKEKKKEKKKREKKFFIIANDTLFN